MLAPDLFVQLRRAPATSQHQLPTGRSFSSMNAKRTTKNSEKAPPPSPRACSSDSLAFWRSRKRRCARLFFSCSALCRASAVVRPASSPAVLAFLRLGRAPPAAQIAKIRLGRSTD